MDVISLQSRVKSGYVGNAVAEPVLMATGAVALPIDSVLYPHHPGHGPATPDVTSLADLTDKLEIAFARCTAPVSFLSGYLANAPQGRAALDQVRRARNAGRLGSYFLDPVFGDDAEGTYVDPSLITFFRDDALPQCDVLLPNRYELAVLSGISIMTPSDAVRAARVLIDKGPSMVVVSSVPAPDDQLANILVTRLDASAIAVKRRNLRAKGTGDLLSAAFAGLHTAGADPRTALSIAVSLVDAVTKAAADHNRPEMDLLKVLKTFDFSKTDASAPVPIELLDH